MKAFPKSIGRVAILVALISLGLMREYGGKARASEVAAPMLVHTCLITGNFSRMVDFYQHVLGVSARVTNGSYAEFPSSRGVLAIFSADAQEKYIPGAASAARNKSAILEFQVENVDEEYARIRIFVKIWVKAPANTPWRTRSFYFRDPDGNLVDFYAPVKAF